jgi:hypothetical protein
MGLPELEVRCWKCWGEGVLALEDHGEMVECSECVGLGWIPTQEGKKLLDFLQRHLVIESEEENEE